jgi:hypothetical protein
MYQYFVFESRRPRCLISLQDFNVLSRTNDTDHHIIVCINIQRAHYSI